MLYSDQTSLSNNRRINGYPMVMSIGNIACDLREGDEGHCLLAVLPILSGELLNLFSEFFQNG